jgi:S-adenosylmethionine:tRNA ribosyltransferase-isomerase
LHFDTEMLANLENRQIATAPITLHIGPGTFRPPSPAQVARRRLHREFFFYPAATDAAIRATRQGGGRVIAVGTTSLRVLETVRMLQEGEVTPDDTAGCGQPTATLHWSQPEDGSSALFVGTAQQQAQGWEVQGATRLFIKPPDRVPSIDGLLTNFHLPASSLLMLVAAVAPAPLWQRAYRYAVAQRFRFYSYGDAMLILPCPRKGESDG